MKKYVIFIIFGLFLISCYNDSPQDTVEDSSKVTTTYLQNLPKDTVLMSIDNNMLYIFERENVEVIVQTKTNKPDAVSINLLYLVLIHSLLIAGIIFLIK
jgi:PBP1b-binding outer membrane lipoprotein LpoB